MKPLSKLLMLCAVTFSMLQAQGAALPSDSLYHVDAPLQTSDGRTMSFAHTDGRVRLVSMFYANCPMACPLTLETIRKIDATLSAAQRSRLHVLLISLDPERDTPAALKSVAQARGISDKRWTLARATSSDTRKLAAVLGIQYRTLDNSELDHSSILILLDATGRVLAKSSKLGTPAPEFLAAVQSALNGAAAQ